MRPLAQKKNRGAALITVLVALMIMSMLLLEFQYSAMVERKLAYNELNQIQAYYLAKSGIRIGLLRVTAYARTLANPNLKQAFGGQPLPLNYFDMIWNLPLPPFPPPPSQLKNLNLSLADRSADEKTLKQTHLRDGESTHVITSEGSKINLNFLATVPEKYQSTDRLDLTCRAPTALFMHVACLFVNLLEGFIRESEDPVLEYGNLRPEELVFDIMDWVNQGGNRYLGGNKDGYYLQLKPPYKAKRNRFYTLDELKMVKGIDERLYNKIKPHVTVYSDDGRIDLNTATSRIYKAIYPDFTDDDITKLLEKRKELNNWPTEAAFVDFVSTNLGRGGFKSLYSDPNNYPFSVKTRSFVIEALGTLRRSKTQIQKKITVGVALTRSKGSGKVPNITNPADCNNPSYIWDPRPGRGCYNKPTDAATCINEFTGTWSEDAVDGKCCNATTAGIGKFCLPKAGAPAAGGQTPAAAQEPNAIKILYWSET